MNREIKFRAWDKKEKRWIDNGHLRINGWGVCWQDKEFEERDLELMQFTGLKDKNGKKIYEGDIMKTTMKPEMTDIFWEIKWAKNNDGNMWGWMCSTNNGSYILDDSLQEQGEVIGNIYENPELLK